MKTVVVRESSESNLVEVQVLSDARYNIMNIRRKETKLTDFIKRPIRDGVGVYRIVDDLGIDQIYRTDEGKQGSFLQMYLRCNYNIHRNARVFVCIIKEKHIPKLTSDKRIELYEELKRRAVSFKEDV